MNRHMQAGPGRRLGSCWGAPPQRQEKCHGYQDGAGQSGGDSRPGGAALGGPDPALPAPLQHLGRAPAHGDHPCPRPHQVRLRQGEPRPGAAARPQGPGHHGRRRRGAVRPARRRVSPDGVADRLRHPDQHEPQRGAGEPGQRAARRRTGRGAAGAPQRRGEQEPVQQRCLPQRHEPGGRHRHHRPAAAGSHHPQTDPGQQGRRLRRHHQDWPHPSAGRHPPHPGSGDLRLGHPARSGGAPPECRPAPSL
ncbi:hypothetical protein D3C73_561040 [compost metagenome]